MKKIIILILIALMQLQAGVLLADPGTAAAVTEAQLAAQREAQLLSRIHGTRSARGMVVNDVAALKSIKLEPVQLRNGQYMLRAIDTNTGQFVKVSHPSVKAMLRDIGTRRFVTPEAASASAPAHKGWLTRTASELEATYRGRLGGLGNQLKQVRGQNAPAPATTTEPAVTAPKPAAQVTAPKPTVAETGVVPKPAGTGSGSGAPAPSVTNAAASETAAVSANGTGSGTSGSTAGANGATTPASAPKTGTGSGVKSAVTEPAAPSSTAAAAAESAAPMGTMAKAGSALKGALKGSMAAIPIMLATGLAVDLANQQRRDGYMSFERAAENIMSPEFLGAMMGSVTGGTLGNVAGTMLSGLAGPLGPFVKAALTIGGAAMGANLGTGAQIDWGRLLFTTAITAGVSLVVPGGIVGLGLLAGTGFGADKLYDWLFKKNESRPQNRPRATPAPATTANQNPPPPPNNNSTAAGGNPPPPPPPTPTPAVVAVPPTPDRTAPAPRVIVPPTPPDKSDLYGDLPYR